MCSISIRENIAAIDVNVIFSTRQFLSYGKRNAVDQTFYRLVKSGVIIRVARGVFVKKGSVLPTCEEIVKVKTNVFGKLPFEHAGHIAGRLGLCGETDSTIFDVNGSSSSFNTHQRSVNLKGTAGRKLLLQQTSCGQLIRAIWHQGEKRFTETQIRPLRLQLKLIAESDFARLSLLMPAWINDSLVG